VTVFRKKRQQGDSDDTGPAEGVQPVGDELDGDDMDGDELDGDELQGEELDGGAPAAAGAPGRAGGPFDLAEVDDPAAGGRVDLGGVWLPGRPGLEVRIEADQQTAEVVAVTLVLGEGALQVQPFAAPRSEGIWDEVRAEIRTGITRQGGTADEVEGPLGIELRTRVPVRAADGTQAVQPARFVGVDGPRWFLRGVLTGKPALEPGAESDADLVALFREIVVVRGDTAMAPRDPIPLHLPSAATEPQDDEAVDEQGHDLKPFERGPEITEIH
jgi:hypothetical protein